jgi:hypothetical protein
MIQRAPTGVEILRREVVITHGQPAVPAAQRPAVSLA